MRLPLSYDAIIIGFDSHTTQLQLFEESGVKEILDRALNGYAATVFAYGQTGSGKTFTMSGEEQKISNLGITLTFNIFHFPKNYLFT